MQCSWPVLDVFGPERLAVSLKPLYSIFPAQDPPPITPFGHELRSPKPFAGAQFPDDTRSNELPFPVSVWPCLSFLFLLDTTLFTFPNPPSTLFLIRQDPFPRIL